MVKQSGNGAGTPRIYAEQAERTNWVIPLSALEGLRKYLAIYQNLIKKLRRERKFNDISEVDISDIKDLDDEELKDLEKDFWTWMIKKIKGKYRYFENPVSAGGQRTYYDDIAPYKVDLEELFSTKPDISYFVRVVGESMVDIGIDDSDMLQVEEFLGDWKEIKNGTVLIVRLNNELMVKIFHRPKRDKVILYSANRKQSNNPDYKPREIDIVEEQGSLNIQGIVKSVNKAIIRVSDEKYLQSESCI